MISHVVIIWVQEPVDERRDLVVSAAERLLTDIPGVEAFHVGVMLPTDRPVVDKSYHVALNMQFERMELLTSYQKDPKHVEFVEQYLKPNMARLLVYDFES